MEPKERPDKKQEHVIETASATTSSDNSNSGPFAYIIAGITLGVAILLALLASGCVSLVLATTTDQSTGGVGQGYAYPDYQGYPSYPNGYDSYDNYYDQELEELLEQFYGGQTGSPQTDQGHDKAGTASVKEALGYDLAVYGTTIDSEVSASSYAGIPSSARTFVRDVLAKDDEYTSQVVRFLQDAEFDEAKMAEHLKEVKDACSGAKEAISAIEIPAIDNDEQGTAKDALGTAKDEAIHRWEQIEAEIDLLSSGSEVEKSKLWEVDDKVAEKTESAAVMFMDAMESIASKK